MNIDEIVAIVVFLFFVIWSFSYYFSLFQFGGEYLAIVADLDKDKIIDYLSINVYSVPVVFESANETNDSILLAKSVWYSGNKNTTRVFFGDQSLPCRIEGDDLYWQVDLEPGDNQFTIEFSDANMSLRCNSTFPLSEYNLTIPWSLERKCMISMSKVNGMSNMSYEDFKDHLDIDEDFRIELKTETSNTTYGKSLPSNVDIKIRTFASLIWETLEGVNITLSVW
jgi:hypothetical protein